MMIDDSVCGSYVYPDKKTEMANNVRMKQDLNMKIVCCCQLQSKTRQRPAIPHSADQENHMKKNIEVYQLR